MIWYGGVIEYVVMLFWWCSAQRWLACGACELVIVVWDL